MVIFWNKNHQAFKGVWLSNQSTTLYTYFDDGTWTEYTDSTPDKLTRYKTVTETISGFVVIAPLDQSTSRPIFKMIGNGSVLIKTFTAKNIETDGTVETLGKWLNERRSSFYSIITIRQLSYIENCY